MLVGSGIEVIYYATACGPVQVNLSLIEIERPSKKIFLFSNLFSVEIRSSTKFDEE